MFASNLEDDEKAKNLLAELMSSTNYRKEKSLDGVWRRWLSVRTLFREQKMPYTWNQAAYHYSKNQLYLKGDMDRMRNGTYKESFDWIDDFNRDVMNYRYHEYSLVCS
jgi:singapore isolate B (sub-type 7) whole genome shotgun sequence assembly, scaffold_6